MARPTNNFAKGYEPNRVWKGPTPDIADLHTHFSHIHGGDRSLSCWELEPGEYQEVVRTGKVYLHVYGMHPPVFVSSALELIFGDERATDEPSVLARHLNEARQKELEEAKAEARRDALIDAENKIRALVWEHGTDWGQGVADAAQIIADMQEATSGQEDAGVDS